MTERDTRDETTGRFASYKEQVGAVEHFLGLNGLTALKFKLKKSQFEEYMATADKLIPICLRDFGKSSTTVFVKNFEYDYDTETLTINSAELQKYIK
jgi:hypothetical protein